MLSQKTTGVQPVVIKSTILQLSIEVLELAVTNFL